MAAEDPGPSGTDASDLAHRIDQLSMRVDALAAFVENLFERAAPSGGVTSHELSDVAARMVRLIEVRLDTQSERLGQEIAALRERRDHIDESQFATGDLDSVDQNVAVLGRAVLEVQRSIDHLRESMPEVNELPIMAHIDRWFEETNSRLATDVEHMRRDFNRIDQAIAQLEARTARLPDGDAFAQLLQALPQSTANAAFDDIRQLVAEMPRHIALQDPVARLDAAIIERIDARIAELAREMADKLHEELAVRVQRFEALSQSMMTLAGEPLDRLTDKLNEIAREREPTVGAARAVEQMQATLAAIRQEGFEREALLRHLMDTIGRTSGTDSS